MFGDLNKKKMKLKTKNIRIPNKEKFPRKLKKAIKTWMLSVLKSLFKNK